MDSEQIKTVLTTLLTDIAAKAREDALTNNSDIGSIFRKDSDNLLSLDPKAVEDAIIAIDKATATKEGTRRLINGILVVAKIAARLTIR